MSRKRDREDKLDLLTLLKETPPTNRPLEKILIEILESGVPEEKLFEDSPAWSDFYVLLSAISFIEATRNLHFSMKEKSISIPIAWSPGTSPTIPLSTEQLGALKRGLSSLKTLVTEQQQVLKDYLSKLKIHLGCDPAEILHRLPYWPLFVPICEAILDKADTIARQANKTRWTNTLRYLEAADCPLGEETRKHVTASYRFALAVRVELQNLPRLVRGQQKRLGFPRNPKRGWERIIKPLVNYLNPFCPIYVKRNGELRPYEREGAISQATYQIVANILYSAYPTQWPAPDARRVKRLFHSC